MSHLASLPPLSLSDEESAGVLVQQLPVARYRLDWRALQPIDGSQYLGSAWRGVFGHALRRLVCVTRSPSCDGCMLLQSCSYPYLFETPGSPDAIGGAHSTAPHPFLFRIETSQCASGQGYSLTVVLVGRAISFLAYVVRAFEAAAQHGIGAARLQFRLVSVSQETPVGSGLWRNILNSRRCLDVLPPTPPTLPPAPLEARIRLLTPLRLRSAGAYVSTDDPLGEMAASVIRRCNLMLRFHGSSDLLPETARPSGFPELFRLAKEWKPLRSSLRWHDWTRFSNRQQIRMQMGGLLGDMDISLENRAALWPFLWLGQYIHAGKASSMGLGAYHIQAIAESASKALGSSSATPGRDTPIPSTTPNLATLPSLGKPQGAR